MLPDNIEFSGWECPVHLKQPFLPSTPRSEGAKTPDDLFMEDYFHSLEKELYDFKFIPCLSRVEEGSEWTGFKGRVNNAIVECISTGANKEAYLCGNEPMINSVVDVLTKKDVPEELIYFDKF